MASQNNSDKDIIPMGKAIAIIVSVVLGVVVLVGGGAFFALNMTNNNSSTVATNNNQMQDTITTSNAINDKEKTQNKSKINVNNNDFDERLTQLIENAMGDGYGVVLEVRFNNNDLYVMVATNKNEAPQIYSFKENENIFHVSISDSWDATREEIIKKEQDLYLSRFGREPTEKELNDKIERTKEGKAKKDEALALWNKSSIYESDISYLIPQAKINAEINDRIEKIVTSAHYVQKLKDSLKYSQSLEVYEVRFLYDGSFSYYLVDFSAQNAIGNRIRDMAAITTIGVSLKSDSSLDFSAYWKSATKITENEEDVKIIT